MHAGSSDDHFYDVLEPPDVVGWVASDEEQVRAELRHIWSVMQECVERGTTTPGTLRC